MATFSTSGLASGLDTASIVDKLVALESAPITALQKRQTGIKAQVSTLGDLATKLSALETAAQALKTGGALGVTASSTNTTFSAVPDATAGTGGFSVQVTALAQVAKARTTTGLAAGETVKGGVLHLKVQGTTYDVTIDSDASLAGVARAIGDAGVPVSATVLSASDGKSYLSITDKASGFPLTGVAADALTLTFDVGVGATGTAALAFTNTQVAANAAFSVDGLSFTRTSNLVTDAIPGVSLTLKAPGAAETLQLTTDADATKKNLQTFVDAYNAVANVLQTQLTPAQNTDRSSTLAGSSMLRQLQGKLQELLSTVVGTSTVRTAGDVGLKIGNDGTLSLDADALKAALGRDPAALNTLFAQSTTGLGDLTKSLVESYVDSTTGILALSKDDLTATIKRLTEDQARIQSRIDLFRSTLEAQFTAMETTLSKLKSVGSFLSSQSTSTSSTN